MNSLCVRWPFQWLLELYHSKAWYGFIYSGVYDTVDPLPLSIDDLSQHFAGTHCCL